MTSIHAFSVEERGTKTAPGAPFAAQAPGLVAKGVTKRFGDFTALDQVSLTLHPGTVHALLGENGAGKSTLVKCIMGFYHADAGELQLDGRARRHRHGLPAFHAGPVHDDP
jgi:ABC-type sugar transport system ATPase subunit